MAISDARRQYLLAEVVALEAMSRMPDVYRPESNIADLKEMLNEMACQGTSTTSGRRGAPIGQPGFHPP